MEQHEKLIKITPNCWHYRLIKYIWGIDPKMFMNLCPYFWLTIASLVVVPFVWVYRKIVSFFRKIEDYIDDYLDNVFNKDAEIFIKQLKPEHIIELSKYGYSESYCDVKIPSFITKKHSYTFVINKWKEINKIEDLSNFEDNWKNFKEKINSERFSIEREKIIEEQKKNDKLKKDKEKLNNVIKNTKHITGFIITAFLSFVFFFVIKLFVYIFVFFTELIMNNLVVTGSAIAIILGTIIGLTIVALYCKRVENIVDRITDKQHASIKEWIISAPALIFLGVLYVIFYWIIYLFLWKWIIYATYKGLKNAFFTFTGIFGEYFGASYSDYCPGIEWDEDDNN